MVELDAAYLVLVNGTNGDVEIQDTEMRTGKNLIAVSGSVVGKPNKVNLTIAMKDSRVQDLLKIVQHDDPFVVGKVSFHAAVSLNTSPGKFLQRLGLKGEVSLTQVSFAKPDTQHDMDAFAARVQKDPPGGSKTDPLQVTATASSSTAFHEGLAYFPVTRCPARTLICTAPSFFWTPAFISPVKPISGETSLARQLDGNQCCSSR